jgi:hypothetical protein
VARRPLRIFSCGWKFNLKIKFQKNYGYVDRIYLTPNRNSWLALVEMLMKLRFAQNTGIFRLSEELLVSEEVYCFM